MVNDMLYIFYIIKKRGISGKGYIFYVDTDLVVSWEEKWRKSGREVSLQLATRI